MRARERLRARLTRRGLAPTAGLLGALLCGEDASAAMPSMLVDSTVRAALRFGSSSGSAAGLVSSTRLLAGASGAQDHGADAAEGGDGPRAGHRDRRELLCGDRIAMIGSWPPRSIGESQPDENGAASKAGRTAIGRPGPQRFAAAAGNPTGPILANRPAAVPPTADAIQRSPAIADVAAPARLGTSGDPVVKVSLGQASKPARDPAPAPRATCHSRGTVARRGPVRQGMGPR